MDNNELLENYKKLNNSYKDTLLFNLGVDAGFFSEFNNMILAMLFCLKNKIKFKLYSKDANFALTDGWKDFFAPFCEEDYRPINNKFNLRPYQLYHKRSPIYYKKSPVYMLLKSCMGVKYFTQDLWDMFHNHNFAEERINLPELGLKNTKLVEAAKVIIDVVWNYNALSRTVIQSFKESINLPYEYISIHIRSGDKSIETELFDAVKYLELAKSVSTIRNAFILTDDYSIFEELERKYHDWSFFTLCSPQERGYYHQDFKNQDKYTKYLQHLKLFASIDICSMSDRYIGTYSSNPGMYMGMRIGESKCSCLDYKSWIIW